MNSTGLFAPPPKCARKGKVVDFAGYIVCANLGWNDAAQADGMKALA